MSRLRRSASKEVETLEVETIVEAKEVKEAVVPTISKAVKNAEAVETTVETVEDVNAEPKVRINPKQDVRAHVGDQWYNLKAGVKVNVPQTVKEKLQKAGMLNPL